MAQTFCVIRSNDHIVVNSILAEDGYDPGPGFYLGPEGGSHGDSYNTTTQAYKPPRPVYPPIATQRSKLLDRAFKFMNEQLEKAVAIVTIGGTPYSFGCDAESRENIMGINTAIALGLPIPNPRPWIPKGSVVPVECTHADLAAIGGALLAKKDAYMAAYFIHKAAIFAEEEPGILQDYDVRTGYDEL